MSTKIKEYKLLYINDRELSSDTDDTDYEIGKCYDERVFKKSKLKRKTTKHHKSTTLAVRKKSSRHNYDKKGNIDNNYPTVDTWSVLPTEILSYVFQLLILLPSDVPNVRLVIRCALVCKHWCEVVKQPFTWKTADLSFMGGSKEATDSNIINLVKAQFSELKELNLSGWIDITDKGLIAVSKYCKKLQSLNISFCQRKEISKVSENSLLALAEKCSLKKINFSNLRVAKNYSKAMKNFLELSGINLTHINLSQNIALGSSLLTSVCRCCTSLKSLDLSNTSVRCVSFSNLQDSCQLLEELYLSNLNLEPKPFKHQDAQGFPALKACSLAVQSFPGWLTDNLLLGITKNAENLTHLDIRGNSQVTRKGFFLCTTKLEKLFISGCEVSSDISELIFQRWSHSLLYLDLSKIKPSQESMTDIVNCVLKCSKLTHLDLTGTSVFDVHIQHVLKSLPNLCVLDLTSCRSLSRGIKRLHSNEQLGILSEKIKNL
ncbi:F-box/LRR-repeat protein 6 [Hydra vulgaris]|uniref:F-box/LRR-repeat protein 6 n=1 Tax=Hydra vulgaris TaxID=6087 RepID=UPI001F5E6F68|nr:F-box/LRR-repeat protein 6 [Hydra vulgaris]